MPLQIFLHNSVTLFFGKFVEIWEPRAIRERFGCCLKPGRSSVVCGSIRTTLLEQFHFLVGAFVRVSLV